MLLLGQPILFNYYTVGLQSSFQTDDFSKEEGISYRVAPKLSLFMVFNL